LFVCPVQISYWYSFFRIHSSSVRSVTLPLIPTGTVLDGTILYLLYFVLQNPQARYFGVVAVGTASAIDVGGFCKEIKAEGVSIVQKTDSDGQRTAFFHILLKFPELLRQTQVVSTLYAAAGLRVQSCYHAEHGKWAGGDMVGILSVRGVFSTTFGDTDALADSVHCGLYKSLYEGTSEKLKANLEHQQKIYAENSLLSAKIAELEAVATSAAAAAAEEAFNVGEKRARTETDWQAESALVKSLMQELKENREKLDATREKLDATRDKLDEERRLADGRVREATHGSRNDLTAERRRNDALQKKWDATVSRLRKATRRIRQFATAPDEDLVAAQTHARELLDEIGRLSFAADWDKDTITIL
jgi:hypothetical protein